MPQPMLPQCLCNLYEEHGVPEPRKRRSRCSIALSILLAFVIICICHQLIEPVNQASIHALRSIQSDRLARHPDKVVAVVQYDDPNRIALLDCYLKRDLLTNAGPLSSIIFFHPPDIPPSDSHALDVLISTSPHYIRHNISTTTIPSPNIRTLLPLIAEPATLYITIPSSTVYIRPHALHHLITSKLSHPTQPITIANSITAPQQPPSTPSHRRTGWLIPTRRTVSDPPLLLDDAETVPSCRAPASVRDYRSLLLSRVAANSHPPHRDPEGEEGREARLHISFMHSLTLGRLDKWVSRSRPIASARIFEGNVAAVWGADVLDTKRGSVWDGEVWMDGMALVALLDEIGEEGTEVLERWREYARDTVCPGSRNEGQGIRQEGMEGVELKR